MFLYDSYGEYRVNKIKVSYFFCVLLFYRQLYVFLLEMYGFFKFIEVNFAREFSL